MLNFDYCVPTRLIFGKGVQRQVGAEIKPYAKKVLLHYGGGSIKKSGLYDEIVESLDGIDFVELGGVVPNPRLQLVNEGIELCRKENVDLILAVGGGSVIDSAKAIAAGVYYNGDVWDLYDKRIEIEKALPVVTVLTIPAAGSEASPNTVITHEAAERKKGYSSQLLRPLMSFINPELFFTLPKSQLANGVADMMSHIFERYFTNTTHTDLTDGLCEATLKTIMKNALVLMDNISDYDAWCEIGFASTVAHMGILGLGREQDWGCHAMEHELSAIYDVPHGAGLAVVTPSWMKHVYKENLGMFERFAVNVMGVNDIELAIDRLREFFAKMELPGTLSELGIDGENLEVMAKKATERRIGGLKKLEYEDVLAIYKGA